MVPADELHHDHGDTRHDLGQQPGSLLRRLCSGEQRIRNGGSEMGDHYFKRTANNTTYLAIGFPININHSRVMFKTSSGFRGCA